MSFGGPPSLCSHCCAPVDTSQRHDAAVLERHIHAVGGSAGAACTRTPRSRCQIEHAVDGPKGEHRPERVGADEPAVVPDERTASGSVKGTCHASSPVSCLSAVMRRAPRENQPIAGGRGRGRTSRADHVGVPRLMSKAASCRLRRRRTRAAGKGRARRDALSSGDSRPGAPETDELGSISSTGPTAAAARRRKGNCTTRCCGQGTSTPLIIASFFSRSATGQRPATFVRTAGPP